MSRTDDSKPKDSAEGIRAVERFWQVRLEKKNFGIVCMPNYACRANANAMASFGEDAAGPA